jgi:hypothetical protein
MSRVRWSVGAVLVGTTMYAAGVLTEVSSWTSPADPMLVSVPARSLPEAARGSGIPQFTPAERDVPRRLDLRGNEIARPVARYRLDEHGMLYEVHSPLTEVQRLGPPKL